MGPGGHWLVAVERQRETVPTPSDDVDARKLSLEEFPFREDWELFIGWK